MIAERVAVTACAENATSVFAFAVGEADAEAFLVEIDDRGEIRRRTVVEIRWPAGERAQHRALEASDILPAAGDQRTAGVRRLHGFKRRRRVTGGATTDETEAWRIALEQ